MRVPPLLRAIHFGPALLVCAVSFLTALHLESVAGAAEVTMALFCGQCVVGWTNDLVDVNNDRLAERVKKPLVSGDLDARTLQILLPIMAVLTVGVSLLSPLHVKGTALHVAGLLSATLYNVWLKRTPLSFVPYVVSFSLLPLALYSTVSRRAPLWLVVAFATVACSFHFLNVIKDLEVDRQQGILGLPQRVGKGPSLGIAGGLLVVAVLDIVFMRSH
jgi:4-hydroxybenzoate polyprenyltransferase